MCCYRRQMNNNEQCNFTVHMQYKFMEITFISIGLQFHIYRAFHIRA